MQKTPMVIEKQRILSAYETVRTELLKRRDSAGNWTGCLSSSALSTATAVSALSLYREGVARHEINFAVAEVLQLDAVIDKAYQWLLKNQNRDGGWGDTDLSLSNISATFLVKSALILAKKDHAAREQLRLAEKYLVAHRGMDGIKKRYGKDQTFSVPIMTNAALAGFVSWKHVPQLPFELAAFPQSLFRFLDLGVVSYAIPALVAMGLVRFYKQPGKNLLLNFLRKKLVSKTLKKIQEMQPESGGYLEASPLTAFVSMSLIGCGFGNHPVVQNGIRFLLETVTKDGAWQIDVNLANWGTSLAVNALAQDAVGEEILRDQTLLNWILTCRHKERHPFTGAAAGGWGWTNRSGGVPDADDTAGTLLALAKMYQYAKDRKKSEILESVTDGMEWLLKLQNRNGGMPTFCRGWGKLPFDRSSVDLTAHALRALTVWRRFFEKNQISLNLITRMKKSITRGEKFILSQQKNDGSWTPLWFGNQFDKHEENPVYGTAKVLCYLGESFGERDKSREEYLFTESVEAALNWAAAHQNNDGGWGCREVIEHVEYLGKVTLSSIEETAVMLEGLKPFSHLERVKAAYRRGLLFLLEKVEAGTFIAPSPIGLYFAKLWYYETLYPVIFTAAALAREISPP
jgi:squalene-hopene/tetraprenyl-beta-curcumene cyclase